MLTTFFVLTRIVANPLSNVFQKRLGTLTDARFIILVTHLLLTVVCGPILLLLGPQKLGAAFWWNMLICAVLAVAGNTLIVAALKSADLSVLGPLNAYKSIVGLLLGAWMLREYPNMIGIAGVGMILAGSIFIMDRQERRGNAFAEFVKNPGVQLRFMALVLSAAEAVFLKKALLLSSPAVTFLSWCLLGLPLAAVMAIYGLRAGIREQVAGARRGAASCLLLAGTTGLMQFSTLYTFDALQVGYSLALFQASTLLSVLFGYHFFQEQHIARRLAGALVMITGAVLIVWFGSAA